MVKTYTTKLGTYRTGVYAANSQRWYGKVTENGMQFVSREEFMAAIEERPPPELDPLEF